MKIIFVVLIFSSSAFAQTYQRPRYPSSYLSKDDQKILRRGEITDSEYTGGGILGSVIGFGTGHLVQRRYAFRGMTFSIGEGVGTVVFFLFGGGASCPDNGGPGDPNPYYCSMLQTGQIIALSAVGIFKIWEIIDLWVVPPKLNQRFYELHRRFGLSSYSELQFLPVIISKNTGYESSSLNPGMTFRFNF